jgi:SAM-dependent methyltransferase
MTNDFTKEFFIRTWGPGGYYENFSYGVGIEKVCEVCLYPFLKQDKQVLEIGSGGGVFTERIIKETRWLTCIDVIPKPKNINPLVYIELPDKDYSCTRIPDHSQDFAFAYNVFCHLSNEALTEYIKSVYRVLKPGGDFVFMLSSYGGDLGTLLDMGHFAQDDRTIDIVVGPEWEIVSRNMIPEHRDIIVHLRKPIYPFNPSYNATLP